MKNSILITGPYLPGKSYGGPVKSLYNMVETLGDIYEIFIITNDRDLNSEVPYENVEIGKWNKVGKANVLYSPKDDFYRHLKEAISEKNFDIIYCSSFFAKLTLLVHILSLLKRIRVPIIIAPRGEFSIGALGIKTFKKKAYLILYKLLKMHKKVTFTCSTEKDKKDIERVFGRNIAVHKASNIVGNRNDTPNRAREKVSGEIKIVTVSRVSSIKNIDYSLELLLKIAQRKLPFNNIIFDIYGPIEDRNYYNECMDIISKINTKIKVTFKGIIDYEDVMKTLNKYHIFLFPTKGENFGHVIQEALLSGCPVIISDQTPWRGLQELGVGFEFPLTNDDKFIEAIKFYLNMDNRDFSPYSQKAFEYGVYKVDSQLGIEEHLNLFNQIIDKGIGDE
ncbi:glycosyltransferase family 4 protein [Bacillus sp. BGMRC 2118]|nr:glycosyltransferase family 4 protein [Bacillus sp. BGMRC 2118]